MNYENKSPTYSSIAKSKISAPSVIFSKSAVKWLSVITELHDKEVGVIGIVKEVGENSYLIDEIFYPKHQEMNHGTCEISPEGEAQVAQWLISKEREDDIEKVRFWGHSHHTMGVGPSSQDEEEAINRMERNKSFFIRGIFNKEGKLSISFYDYQAKRRFDNIKWETDPDEEEASIREKVKELMKENVPEETHTTGTGIVTAGHGDGFDYQTHYGHNGFQNYNGVHDFRTNKGNGKGKGKGKGKFGAKRNASTKMYTQEEVESMVHNWEGMGHGDVNNPEFPEMKEFEFERGVD